ncbi:MAG: primosomal protein N' [Acidobacteriota bacterium]|nr:primosomal protein N' [Acidobacteriota bacterium]
MSLFADVVFALPLPRAFTYAIPESLRGRIRPGQRVLVPLGTRAVKGFVVRTHDQAPPAEVKPVLDLVDPDPIIPPDILDLTDRLSRRFLSSRGEMLRTAVPPSQARRGTVRYALTEAGRAAAAAGSLSAAEARLASVLADKAYTPAYLKTHARMADAGAAAGRMAKKGYLLEKVEEKTIKPSPPAAAPGPALQMGLDFRIDGPTAEAIRILTAGLSKPGFAPFLLVGPADRRTAAILAVCGDVLAGGRSVLALFPEIGMSRAVSEAFASRLGERAVILHGGMSDTAKEQARRRIDQAHPAVVAGPRSAIFIPMPNLGLIVVDEESDESYRQTESPTYDARTGAWMRAEAAGIRLVLAGDAPRIETYERAGSGGWLVEIPGPAPRPAEIVDDRGQRGLLAKATTARIGTAVEAGRRVLVFARRKGYASFLFCPRCGHVPACGRCGAALSLGGQPRRLQCRRCGFTAAAPYAPTVCESCGARVVEPRGPGVEAVEEELKRLFPKAGAVGFDSARIRTPSARQAVLDRFASGEIGILVGSPLLAHQPEIAAVSLIVLLNPEGTLGLTDFDASARLYGEIRRPLKFLDGADPAAEAVIQTSWPDHFALRAAAAGNYRSFFKEEIFRRRALGDPPFSALAEIVLAAGDARTLGRAARDAASRLRASGRKLDVLGPSEVFVSAGPRHPKAGESRSAQIVVRADDPDDLDEAIADALRDVTIRKTIIRAG